MSLTLFTQIPGSQIKRDRDLSNVTIQCDPTLLVPSTSELHRKNTAGKIAVEHDICNLDVNNLTVFGKLTVSGSAAEICDIFCPVDFNLVAGNNVNITSLNSTLVDANAGITLTNAAVLATGVNSTILLDSRNSAGQNAIQLLAEHPTPALPGGDIAIDASVGNIFLSAGGAASVGNVTISAGGATATGDVSVTASNDVTITAGSGTLVSSIALDTSANDATVLEVEVNTTTQVGTLTSPVTIDSVAGVVTLATDTLAADTGAVFTFRNTKLAADSLLLLTMDMTNWPVANTIGIVSPFAITANTCQICVYNAGTATTGAIQLGSIHFLVLNPVA